MLLLKALVQLTCGDVKGAEKSADNFTKTFPVVSQLRSAAEALSGDCNAARETQLEFLRSMSSFADSVPGVGHVKGVVHYAVGDKDGGDNAMKVASRTTGSLAGGAVGFMLGGPAGAVAGGIAGAGILDTATTIVDSEVHGEMRPAGYYKQVNDMIKNPADAGTYFDTVCTIIGDAATGSAGGNIVNNMKSLQNKRQVRKKFEADRKTIENKVGKPAAKDMVETADRMKAFRRKNNVPDNKPHVTSLVSDKKTGRRFEGHNKQVNQACKNVNKSGMSDYKNKSKTHFEQKVPNAKPPLKRSPRACAEHDAYTKFYMEDLNADPAKTCITTVRYDSKSGTIRGIMRCENCIAFKEGMGAVPSDFLDNVVIPNHPGIGKYSQYEDIVKAGSQVVSSALCQMNNQQDYT